MTEVNEDARHVPKFDPEAYRSRISRLTTAPTGRPATLCTSRVILDMRNNAGVSSRPLGGIPAQSYRSSDHGTNCDKHLANLSANCEAIDGDRNPPTALQHREESPSV